MRLSSYDKNGHVFIDSTEFAERFLNGKPLIVPGFVFCENCGLSYEDCLNFSTGELKPCDNSLKGQK